MKVTRDKTENSQAFLTVEMEPAEVDDALEKSYHRLVKRTNVPGFRKGKAPRTVLEGYLGKEGLFEEALNSLIPEACQKALEEQEIEAIAQPEIEITQTEPVIFKAVVSLRPVIEIGDYQQIRDEPKSVTVAEDDVNTVIEQIQRQQMTWEPVERPVEFGDLVVFDIDSSIEDKPLISRQGAQFQALQDAVFPAPGFSQQLVGVGIGEEKEFTLEFPSDYPQTELAGKEAVFKVKVGEVKQEKLPELNDEFSQGVNAEFKTMDMLREEISNNLKLRAEEEARIDFEERVIDLVLDLSKVEFPPILVESEIDRVINQQLQRWQMGGGGMDDYLKRINKTEVELREELRPMATKRVAHSLVLGQIAEEDKTEASDSEIDAEIENMLQGTEDSRKEEFGEFLNTPQSRETIRRSLISRKTVQKLVEVARGSGKDS